MAKIDRFIREHYFLSNFAESWIVVDDDEYPTGEHAFQALKTTNLAQRDKIARAATPSKAKYLGRSLELRDDWDQVYRYDAMRKVLYGKFVDDYNDNRKILGQQLLDTGDALLIEGNDWHDQVWGTCYCSRKSCQGHGMNLLGWMLMDIRAQL